MDPFSSRSFEQNIYENIRLDELVGMQVISLVEDEQCFFTLIFMKIKLKNRLTKHLELVIWMLNQKFFTIQKLSFLSSNSELERK